MFIFFLPPFEAFKAPLRVHMKQALTDMNPSEQQRQSVCFRGHKVKID